MSSPRKSASGHETVHPLARPFAILFAPKAGFYSVILLAVLVVLGFAIEAAMTGGEGLSKYPEVLGGYEVLPALAMAGGILVAWIVRWVLGAGPNFYERAAGDPDATQETRETAGDDHA